VTPAPADATTSPAQTGAARPVGPPVRQPPRSGLPIRSRVLPQPGTEQGTETTQPAPDAAPPPKPSN
jgi:hypothetical protein